MMDWAEEKRFRLRQNNEIVGFMRQIDGRSKFYSKDGFWWNGRAPKYNRVDEWIGLRDKNNTPIYEWDILYFKIDPDGPDHTGVILWEAVNQRFVIRKVDDELYFPFETNGLNLFNTKQLRVYSYLFLNPKLQEYLGISEE